MLQIQAQQKPKLTQTY